MPLETPLLKVSRPVAACSRCRGAKIKCDGKLPACSSCEKSGRAAECTSANDQFARGKERSYVSTLETKIDRLQSRLEEARARKPSVVEPEDDMMSRSQSYQVQEPIRSKSNKTARRKETTAIDDLVSDFGFLSVNATARDFYGFTSAMSYARLILWACSKDPLPDYLTHPLPPRHTANNLIQHYLNNVYVLLPVFDETAFYASVDSVYSRRSDHAEPIDQWSVRLVLAISCASMSEQRGDRLYLEAIGHIVAALEHSEEVLHPGAISSIQALVLLAEFAMLDPHHFDSWGLIGAASRAMVDLGLHQDPPKGTLMSKAKLELRRRVYHCVYALDRSTSLVQSRAFSFSDDSAKVKVPFRRSPSSEPTTPSAGPTQHMWSQSYDHAVDMISLRKLQSIWYTDMFQSGRTRWPEPYTYIWKACKDMQRWFDSLPASTSPHMRAFFELDLLYSYVYILSPSPRVPVISPYARKLVFEYCTHYADKILRCLNDSSYASPLTFYDAMRVYMTGRQFLDLLELNANDILDGSMPSLPETKHAAVSAPLIPVINLPPGENMLKFNIVRSITCIKQITECLSRFGIRWGYMSWNQRYQSEASGMLDELNSRLRDLDGGRRASTWHHQDSNRSLDSGHGSMSYDPSYSQSISSARSVYQQSPAAGVPVPVQAQRNMSISMGNAQAAANYPTSPQNDPFQPADQQRSPLHFGNDQQGQQHYQQHPVEMQPQYFGDQHAQQQHPRLQAFNFNDAPTVVRPAPFASAQGNSHAYSLNRPRHHPTLQFASWAGYGGAGGSPDLLDEENAVPPNSNPWNIDPTP